MALLNSNGKPVEDHLFKPSSEKLNAELVSRPSLSYWQSVWIRLRQNKLAMFGLFTMMGLTVMAIIGPWISPHSIATPNYSMVNQPPSLEYWFGTDALGRDMFARTWYGARISLFVGLVAALIDCIVGIIYGGVSGYKGGRTDSVMMRIVEILYGLPYLLVVILLMVIMGPGLLTIIIALTITGWVGMARIVRGQVLSLKQNEYVLASKVFGASTNHIIRRSLLPNTMGPIIIQMTLTVPTAIFAEAFLSFLGLGISAPYASWGSLAEDGLSSILTGNWWRLFFPAFFISLTMYAFNVFGDGLQDAIDPKTRGK
ncbi:ABC transporter permease [Shouchella lehensis]|uniref:Dipeptide transport system permease protein dppC n=1 Tax=Shouchella lehensis G1 TaxID=1246626 RepID=A0A060LX13_9BACI|nr:ABC transporter permease [Shouchella lehensis]AIC95811.1 Dipeptide transport system permease protein dppC [Shouchella lehensis G1]